MCLLQIQCDGTVGGQVTSFKFKWQVHLSFVLQWVVCDSGTVYVNGIPGLEPKSWFTQILLHGLLGLTEWMWVWQQIDYLTCKNLNSFFYDSVTQTCSLKLILPSNTAAHFYFVFWCCSIFLVVPVGCCYFKSMTCLQISKQIYLFIYFCLQGGKRPSKLWTQSV